MAEEEIVVTADDVGTLDVTPRVVTAVGVSVNSVQGVDISARLSKAMSDEVLKCNAEGISTEEKNSALIRERMLAAHDRELLAIQAEG